MNNNNNKYSKVSLPKFEEDSGVLTVLDKINELVDWDIKRVYWLTDVKGQRGAHCVKGERKIYLILSGSCTARIFDGKNWYEEKITSPNEALIFKEDLWREFDNFSDNSVLCVLSNMHYDKSKYILDLEEFKNYKQNE